MTTPLSTSALFSTPLVWALLLCATLSSCQRKGCTDCNATNYDAEATTDDGTCLHAHTDALGTYHVQDSLTGPPSMEWRHASYQVEVKRATCAPHYVLVTNYAKKNNASSETVFSVECQLDGEHLTVLAQTVDGNHVRSTTGYLAHDSISFSIEYENEFGEVFFGNCFGKKE